MDRRTLVQEMGTARERVMDAVAGLSEEQASRPGAAGWSIKDHLNHLTACDEIRFFEIDRISRGGSPAFTHMSGQQSDTLNELIVLLRRSLSLDQALSDLAAARSRVLEAVAAAPERARDAKLYGEYQIDGSIPHDPEHAEAIRALRQ